MIGTEEVGYLFAIGGIIGVILAAATLWFRIWKHKVSTRSILVGQNITCTAESVEDIAITLTNSGATEVEVTSVTIVDANFAEIGNFDHFGEKLFPFTLRDGESLTDHRTPSSGNIVHYAPLKKYPVKMRLRSTWLFRDRPIRKLAIAVTASGMSKPTYYFPLDQKIKEKIRLASRHPKEPQA